MRLNDLSLEDLWALRGKIAALDQCGSILRLAELEPRFDLTPGQAATISLPPFVWPGRAAPADREPIPSANQSTPLAVCAEAPAAKASAAGAPEPEPADPEPAELAPLAPLPPAAPDLNVATDAHTSAPGTGAGGSEGQAAGAGENPPDFLAAAWTPEEDARAVAICVEMGAAYTVKAAAVKIAAELGRPLAGTEFRLRKKLAEPVAQARIGAAFRAPPAAAPDPIHETAAPEQTPPQVSAAEPAAEGGPAAPPPAATWPDAPPEDELGRHLWNMGRKGDWHLAADRDLVQLATAGLDPDAIAAEMGRPAKDVAARFQALRGPRNFGRAAILARLNQFLDAAG